MIGFSVQFILQHHQRYGCMCRRHILCASAKSPACCHAQCKCVLALQSTGSFCIPFLQLLEAAMLPKARRATVASKSERFVEVMNDLTAKAAEAKQHLKAVRKAQRTEKQRRKRIMKAAARLGASELMEIAGLKQITVSELTDLVQEMRVPKDASERQERANRRSGRRASGSAMPADVIHPEHVHANDLEPHANGEEAHGEANAIDRDVAALEALMDAD